MARLGGRRMPTQAFTLLSSPICPSLPIHPSRRLQTSLLTISGIYFRNCHHFRCEKCEDHSQPFLIVLVHCFLAKHNIFPLMSETCRRFFCHRPPLFIRLPFHPSVNPSIYPAASVISVVTSIIHPLVHLSFKRCAPLRFSASLAHSRLHPAFCARRLCCDPNVGSPAELW